MGRDGTGGHGGDEGTKLPDVMLITVFEIMCDLFFAAHAQKVENKWVYSIDCTRQLELPGEAACPSCNKCEDMCHARSAVILVLLARSL